MSNTYAESLLDPTSEKYDPAICRDYVRNACRRGHRCKFKHPPQEECEKIRRYERIFCHDYQNSTCRRPVCKFLHYTREEEGFFRLTGRLPDITDREASIKPKSALSNSLEKIPMCKDYVNGICSRGVKCKYRHTVNDESPDALTSVLSWRDTLLGETNCPVSIKSNLVPTEPSPQNFVTVIPNSVKSEASLPIQASISSIPQSLIPARQPTILNAAGVIVSASDSLLLNDVYVTNTTQASQPTVVGMLDHVTLSAQPSTIHHQHTIYAHAPTLTSFVHPLASVTNPVLAVVAESTAQTGPGQHPTAVLRTGPQTATYHLLSTSTRSCNTSAAGSLQQPGPQQHLLSTGGSSTACPTVFTIPLTRFACEAPATSATVLHHHHHHPQAVAVCSVPASVFSSAPQVSYPSYGIIQADPSMSTNCTVTTMASCPTIMYPSSSESLVNCDAPAAATNYLTLQKQPSLDNFLKPIGLSANSESVTSAGGLHHHHELQLQQHPSSRSSTMAVAASYPAVSVAAAAAVAAATAIARSNNISAAAVRAGRTAVANHRKLKQPLPPHYTDRSSPSSSFTGLASNDSGSMATGETTALSQSGSLLGDKDTTPDDLSGPPQQARAHRLGGGAGSDWRSAVVASSSSSSSSTTPTMTTTATAKASPLLVKVTEDDDVVDEGEDEGVGTEAAAAFAAAACIGAMFSNPISSCASNTTSVAAMLGDLISGSHNSQLFSSDLKMMSTPAATSIAPSVGAGLTVVSDPGSPSGPVKVIGGDDSTLSPSDCQPVDPHQTKRVIVGSKSGFPHYRFVSYQKTGVHEADSDSTDWSEVPTSVASAAKAAAAAAVAATAAVTNSATGLFRRRLHDAKQKQAVTTSSQVTGSLKGLLSSTRLSSSSSSVALSPPPHAGVSGPPAIFSNRRKPTPVPPTPTGCRPVMISTTTTNTTSSCSSPNSFSCSPPASLASAQVTAEFCGDMVVVGSSGDAAAAEAVSNSGLSGLSPNTAATMTSAATAAAMVAAAATAAAAAKQRRFRSELDSPAYSDMTGSQYLATGVSQSQSGYGVCDDAHYPVSGPTTVSHTFAHSSSAVMAATAASSCSSSKRRRRHVADNSRRHRYAFPCFRGQSGHHDDEEEDDDDEDEDEYEDEIEEEEELEDDEDVFDEDDVEFASAAAHPSVYRRKRTKCQSDMRVSQFHAGSWETSPSEGFSEVEPWSYRQKLAGGTVYGGGGGGQFNHKPSVKSTSVLPPQRKRSAAPTQKALLFKAASPDTHLVRRDARPQAGVPSPTKRAKSVDSVYENQLRNCPSISLFPSKSLPSLAILRVDNSAASGGLSQDIPVTTSLTSNGLPCEVNKVTPSRIMAKSAEAALVDGNAEPAGIHPRYTYSHLNRLSGQCISHPNNRIASHPSTRRPESFSQKRLINCYMQSGRFKKARASPANSMTGDISGTDEYCDDIDTEYYEEDFDTSSRQRLRKRAMTRSDTARVPSLSSYRAIKQNHHSVSATADNCSRASEVDFHCSSIAARQQARALRVENARLRQKVCELMRQRGDLRAANEILLEQNARLRRSSKRASVVARMAESATKIIEAHNKATASQQAQQQTQPFHHSQQAAPNSVSLRHAAAAAVAAVAAAHHHHQQQQQHQSSGIPPSSAPTSCVYASSTPPTASSQASGGPQTAAVVSGATITIAPQHASLATVQMQATPQPLLPQAAEHSGLNFYSHQVSHSLTPIPVSLATSLALSPALSAGAVDSAAATLQVCHYPVASNSTAAAVAGSLGSAVSAATAASVASTAAAPRRNAAVTLVLGQPTPAAFSPATLHLSAEGTVAAAPPYSAYPHAYASLAQATPQPATPLLQPCKLEPVALNTSLGGVPAGAAATVMRLLPPE